MDRVDQQVGQNIRILAQVITEICQHHTLEEASEGVVTDNQLKILKILKHHSDFAVGEIGRLLRISSAAASKNIERLVQLEMVSRQRLADDRRRFHLELLPSGIELLDRYDQISSAKLQNLMNHFETAEKEVLLDLLRRVIRFTLADEKDAELVCLQCAGRCGEDCVLDESQGSCHAPKEVDDHVQPS